MSLRRIIFPKPGAVSRHVQALEDWLGARLVNRTTRRISLTDVGQGFHQRCTQILEQVDEARHAAAELQREPRGQIRVTAPIAFGERYFAPAVAAYLSRYPKIEIEVVLNDRYVDLIDEGFDLAVRVGNLPSSSLVMRHLAPVRFVLVAAPDYVARRGAPLCPDDLAGHDCLLYTHHGSGTWFFAGADGEQAVRVSARLKSNNGDLVLAAALSGEGIFYAPTFQAGEYLAAGRLVRLLPDYRLSASRIQAVFPHSHNLSAKVRSLVDFLAQHFGPEPEWDRFWRRGPLAQAPVDFSSSALPGNFD